MTALALLQNTDAIKVDNTLFLSAVGGTPPYTFAVLTGGAGGTIDVNGKYTSPSITGRDTIRVKDSLNATALVTMNILSPLELVCDILKKELGLANGQVYIYDQKIIIPADEKLYIAVGVLSDKPFGNTNRNTGDTQEQSVNIMSTLSVDIMSRSLQALERKEEVLFAIKSNYAQSQQELNSFHISTISSAFLNLGEIDGAAIPYRFNISLALQYFKKKTQPASYFDTFQDAEILTEE